ncbi:LAMP5 [Branchiostoma lanceolatum]|uniref:Lysosome-associated membrane glycoprotein 5 n=1 Tax=Branchiostoma lanceolatum TaxID=7740 RepID=A0A8J9ZSY5_BRALA|nr:LAMP5 [Branchiostoma lanceolatum]
MEQGGKMQRRKGGAVPSAVPAGALLLLALLGIVSGAPNHSESRPPPNPQRPWHGQHDPYAQHDTSVHDPTIRSSHQSPPIGYSVDDPPPPPPPPPPARNAQAPKETRRKASSKGPQNNQASEPVTTTGPPRVVPNQFGGSSDQTGGGGQTSGPGQTGGQAGGQTGQSIGQSGQTGQTQRHVPVILVPTDPPARQTASQIYEAQEKTSTSHTEPQGQGQTQGQSPAKQNPKPPQPAVPVPRATPIPLPAPSPTPTLPPRSGGIFKGDYVVKDQNGSICVRGSFNARLSIWYQSKRGGKRTVDQAALELPQRPVITGRCGTDKEPAVMDLRWAKGRYRLKLFFSVNTNGSKTSWLVSGVHFKYDTNDASFVKPLSTGPHTVMSAPGTDIFSAPISHSYKCSSRLQVDMTAPDGEEATLVLQDTQIQPFHLGKNGNYGTRRECGADHYGDVIPMAVGLGLGALILLMIVAYYFHRRYQGPPYENM